LLTKLENGEYEAKTPVDLSLLTREALDTFGELIQMKSITLTYRIEDKIFIPLHVSLADLLLTNLLSNAIRHNVPEGRIHVELSRSGLVVVNTGPEPALPTGELFERFKKGDPKSDSIGIGLAIVRQICDLSNFNVEYEFKLGLHMLAVSWLPAVPASKLLQNVSVNLLRND
jgi:signal transduction histidine kinase